jgi:hypothetical protein
VTPADLDALAAATSVTLDGAFAEVANAAPAPADVLARWRGATPQGRVLLVLLLDPERGRHALATLLLDERVAAAVRPMLANDATYAAPPVPRPAGAEAVLARRFAAAFGELCGRAGLAPGDVAGGRLAPLPDPATTLRLEETLREHVLFAPGLLDLATRRAVEVTDDGGPAPGDLDALCPEVQRVLDAATLADLPARGAGAGWWGRRGARVAGRLDAEPPPGVRRTPAASPHDPYAEYLCVEHRDFVVSVPG